MRQSSWLVQAIRTGWIEPLWHPDVRQGLDFTLSELLRRIDGYDVAEHRILTVLASNGYGLSQQAVADRTALDRTTVSETARTLEVTRKLIRAPDPEDGRKRLLMAAPSTRAAAMKTADAARRAEQEALRGLTDPQEREQLKSLLARAL